VGPSKPTNSYFTLHKNHTWDPEYARHLFYATHHHRPITHSSLSRMIKNHVGPTLLHYLYSLTPL